MKLVDVGIKAAVSTFAVAKRDMNIQKHSGIIALLQEKTKCGITAILKTNFHFVLIPL